MARKRKYNTKAVPMNVSVAEEVKLRIEDKARESGKNVSELVNSILDLFSFNEEEFCRAKARRAAQELHYWKSRADAIMANPELFQKR